MSFLIHVPRHQEITKKLYNLYGFRAGLFDWLTLFIPVIIYLLGIKTIDLIGKIGNSNYFFWVFIRVLFFLLVAIPLWLLSTALLIARILIAGILVFNPLSLMIIGIVHWVSQHVAEGAELKEKISSVEVLSRNDATAQQDRHGAQDTKKIAIRYEYIEYRYESNCPEFVKDYQCVVGRYYPLYFAYPDYPVGLQVGVKDLRLKTGEFAYVPLWENPINTRMNKWVFAALKLNFQGMTKRMEDYVSKTSASDSTGRRDCRKILSCLFYNSPLLPDPEVRKNGAVIAQAYRVKGRYNFFPHLPKEVTVKILAFTGELHQDEEYAALELDRLFKSR